MPKPVAKNPKPAPKEKAKVETTSKTWFERIAEERAKRKQKAEK